MVKKLIIIDWDVEFLLIETADLLNSLVMNWFVSVNWIKLIDKLNSDWFIIVFGTEPI